MAKARRTYSDEDKQKILAHNATHGPKVTAEHFNIATSMINRWKKKAAHSQPPRAKGQWRKKKWTEQKVAAVLEYLKTHTYAETMVRFKISGSQLSEWRKHKANGAATNGLGTLPETDALKWLETWRQAYFDRMKAETPSAASVLAALRGGK